MKSESWIVVICIISTTLMNACSTIEAYPEADRILGLPGQPNVSFQQFSGYVAVDENQNRSLFYYFVEAEFDPASKPLVLWLNGGPGCSSVGAGAFSEHGPFKPRGEILIRNDYSWNKEANMLYLESPAGVGFSYSANASFYNNVNDTITAQDNLAFLQGWFLKFPEFKNRDFFVTGESYAGHYVPQLAHLIVQSDLKFNLKGIAIGNPLVEFETDFNAQGTFYWSHGLISDASYELLNSVCNISEMVRESIRGPLSPPCSTIDTQLSREISDYIDGYDVTLDVCLEPGQSQIGYLNHFFRAKSQYLTALQSQPTASYQPEASGQVDVCVEDKTINYLNRKDVQGALHAQLIGVGKWDVCSSVVDYDLLNLEIPTINVVGSLVQYGIPVLVYSGDQDSVIPFIGSRMLVNGLAKELGLNTTVPYRAWFESKQVGGWTQVYGNMLSYATIRGASHLAPFSSPERSLTLFTAFLEGKPLPEV